MNTNKKLNLLIKIGILSAIAVILMFFQIPINPAFAWLKIDFSDVPALIGAFAFGPVAGIAIEALKNILHILVAGSSTAGVGELANFIMGVFFVVPASIIYRRKKTRRNAIIGLAIGTIAVILAGIVTNIYILLPLFGMRMTGEQLSVYIATGVLPINIIKGVLVSIITLVLYKNLSKAIFKGIK
ncbi:MAG: ECF transporter S component [Sarcina sp.]